MNTYYSSQVFYITLSPKSKPQPKIIDFDPKVCNWNIKRYIDDSTNGYEESSLKKFSHDRICLDISTRCTFSHGGFSLLEHWGPEKTGLANKDLLQGRPN
ncbi:hypothetical protein TNIN_480711 [Trichonephila inaurata madagascariensis]|uniref:Uncharacterized protein n=1 Tax=Trichonephila inaurata madagascariensis TaxID=2747483 RepID=A0A8X7BTT9_9ARAC|nr:hypothetical protein TNIN_480711 [Trichonephila inaurata madagascariensis]